VVVEESGSKFLTTNPLFEEGFAAKGATDMSNPLYENAAEDGLWESDEEIDHSAYSYSLVGIEAWGGGSPISQFNYDEGLFDSAVDAVDGHVGLWGSANKPHLIWEAGEASERDIELGLKDDKEVNSGAFCKENLADDFGQDLISLGKCRRRNVERGNPTRAQEKEGTSQNGRCSHEGCSTVRLTRKENSKRRRGHCGILMGTSIANLSTRLCGKVVWLLGCFWSVCNNCFPLCDELFIWDTANGIGI